MDKYMEEDWKNGVFDFCIDKRRVWARAKFSHSDQFHLHTPHPAYDLGHKKS